MILERLVPRLPLRYLRIFWGYARARLLVIVALTLVMSYAEGFGIALLFPLFSQESGPPTSGLALTLSRVFEFVGLPFSPSAALPIVAAVFVGKGVLQYVTMTFQQRLTHRAGRAMRGRLLSALARADYRYILQSNTAAHTNLVIHEVNRAAGGFHRYCQALPPAISAGSLFLIVLFLDWQLTAVCVAMGLTIIGLLRFSGQVARHYSQITTTESSKLTGLLTQMLHAFKYLRATGGYRTFDRKVWQTSETLIEADFRSSSAGALMLSVSQPVMVLFLAGLLYYRTAIRGEEIGSLVIVLMYFVRITTEILALQTTWQAFCTYMGSVDALIDATAQAERHAEDRGEVPFERIERSIALEDVWFSYRPERFALQEINLQIQRYTTVAFVGDSGSGKSTLVDMLTGTLKPTRGRILIDDVDLAAFDLETLRGRIGYVPQDAMLFDDTVANNIALWRPGISASQIREAAERAQCTGFIGAMPEGYDSQLGERGVKLSGGQRQRLAIARELVKHPELLVLDEATSALDSESERAIQASIDQLKGKMTIFIIAHRLSTVRNVDYLYVLHEGRIVEEGRYEQLVAIPGGRFRRMCQLQRLGEEAPGPDRAS